MSFFDTVLNVLKKDERFFSENGELLRNAVYEAAMKMDSNLIKILYTDETIRTKFFTDIDGIAVFDKVGFGWVINNREFLPGSYTRYKNKIGLVNNKGDYISTSNDIELVFPYKDCVLEDGQTKEDQKRSEIFYNETLVPDEVDRLLYPKVLTNAKRYTAYGVKDITDISQNDNLIIKGNNLIGLATIGNKYNGRGYFPILCKLQNAIFMIYHLGGLLRTLRKIGEIPVQNCIFIFSTDFSEYSIRIQKALDIRRFLDFRQALSRRLKSALNIKPFFLHAHTYA